VQYVAPPPSPAAIRVANRDDYLGSDMADIIDQAQSFEATNLAQSLRVQAAIAANTVRPTPRGSCLNSDCEEPFEADSARLFCGPACAQRFEALSKNHR
jgi:hypothetical protein